MLKIRNGSVYYEESGFRIRFYFMRIRIQEPKYLRIRIMGLKYLRIRIQDLIVLKKLCFLRGEKRKKELWIKIKMRIRI